MSNSNIESLKPVDHPDTKRTLASFVPVVIDLKSPFSDTAVLQAESFVTTAAKVRNVYRAQCL